MKMENRMVVSSASSSAQGSCAAFSCSFMNLISLILDASLLLASILILLVKNFTTESRRTAQRSFFF